jgi:hypothetical protein
MRRNKLTSQATHRRLDTAGHILQALASMAACLWLVDLLVRAIAG